MIADAELVAFVPPPIRSTASLRRPGAGRARRLDVPAASQVAWFPDPGGNTLSLTERS